MDEVRQQPNFWRYFRIDGESPTYRDGNFTIEVHHGGMFYRLRSTRSYRGGEVVWVDKNDPDQFSWVCLNHIAVDLGYRKPPITYWFKPPGVSGYVSIDTDDKVQGMLKFVKNGYSVLRIFIVSLCDRNISEVDLEDMGLKPKHVIVHSEFQCNHIDDLEDIEEVNEVVNNGTRARAGDIVPDQAACEGTSSASKRKKRIAGRKKKHVEKKGERMYATRFRGEVTFDEAEFVDDELQDVSDDTEYEELNDSDYELDLSEDDEVFKANVDEVVVDEAEKAEMGYNGEISDGASEESEKFHSCSESSRSDDHVRHDGKRYRRKKKRYTKFPEFNKETDLVDPQFSIGKTFPNADAFKDAIKVLAIRSRKQLRFNPNDKKRVNAICKTSKEKCPFKIWASKMSKESSVMVIRTCVMEHTCNVLGKKKVWYCNAKFIAKRYMSSFIADPDWTKKGIHAAVERDFGLDVGYQHCQRAKQVAKKIIHGTVEDQYNLLESWAGVIRKANPKNTVWICAPPEGDKRRFKSMYVSYAALKQGFKEGCRPLIGLDGTHLRTKLKGIMLTAVGIDANNGMYPISYAIVEQETRESWTWFMQLLRDDLEIENDFAYTIISDKHKGLSDVVKDVLPNSEHRNCARHLYANFKGDGYIGSELKELFWATSRSTTLTWFKKNMDVIRGKNAKAADWLSKRPAQQWSRSHFKTHIKCDILCNNLCEAFNLRILNARKMPILSLHEELRMSFMTRHANRRNAAEQWTGNIGQRIQNVVKNNAKKSDDYTVCESSHKKFQIKGKGVECASGVISVHAVNLNDYSCTCRRFDLTGLPCPHAIAAINIKNLDIENFVDKCYWKETYLKAYTPAIEAIPGIEEWELVDSPIMPPVYKRGPGRPPNLARNPSAGEVPPPPGSTKLSKAHYSVNRCGLCKMTGRNARTCSKHNARDAPEVDPVHFSSQPTPAILHDSQVDNAFGSSSQPVHNNASRGGRSRGSSGGMGRGRKAWRP